MRMLNADDEKDADVEVLWEDQQRINAFSKANTKMQNLLIQVETAEQEKEALDDVATELELADEDQPILYKVGESFLHLPLEAAQARIERDKEAAEAELTRLREAVDGCKSTMQELKVQLYSKFGSSINLD